MKKIESLGWGFFLIVWALTAPLCIFATWQYTYEFVEPQVRVVSALFMAAGLAAVIAWAANAFLQLRHERQREANQKKVKTSRKK